MSGETTSRISAASFLSYNTAFIIRTRLALSDSEVHSMLNIAAALIRPNTLPNAIIVKVRPYTPSALLVLRHNAYFMLR